MTMFKTPSASPDGSNRFRSERIPYVLLETDRWDSDNGRSFLFDRPVGELRFEPGDDPRRFFEAIDRAVGDGYWVAGYFAYEMGYTFERKLSRLLDTKSPAGSLAWVGLFEDPTIAETPSDASLSDRIIPPEAGPCRVSNLGLNTSWDEYATEVNRIKSYLRDGQTYQVNFTMKQRFDLDGPPEVLYNDLRKQQRVSFSACLFDGERTVISLSPELFLRRDGGVIGVKPMKGTARRGAGDKEDERLAAWLATDAKNRAENVMIVDMVRNDLGRIAAAGGVRVSRLFEVEKYETLYQMTSTVEAQVPEDINWFDVMRNLFPCASVTGAPKIRTMELIADLEKEPRGVYTGSIGYMSPYGDACMNVAIRTMVVDSSGKGEMGIGSGVVYDSDTRTEYDECLLKAKFLTDLRPDFELIETTLLEDGELHLVERHMKRLNASAKHFGFRCPLDRIAAALTETAERHPRGSHKVRLLLRADGDYAVSVEPIDRPPRPYRVKLSRQRIDPRDDHRYHKTTYRPVYQRERESARAEGYDEVVFLNTRGEVCEGTISNVFISTGGTLLTPPVSCGLLPGTLREELIARGDCEERVLSLSDLRTAARVYVGNSVQGLVAASLDG
jgi:para-aminobenzoate synthetase/4-amino-4-deoxychorismate lyase